MKRGIQKIDKKAIMYGKKYLPEDASKAVDSFEKEIKDRIKKAGEVQEDVDYNGIKNFPRLCLKLLLGNEYIADMLKMVAVACEFDQKYLKKNPNQLMYGALNSMAS